MGAKQKKRKYAASTNKPIVLGLLRNKKALIMISVSVIALIGVIALIVISGNDIDKAFNSNAAVYDNVKVTIQQNRIDLNLAAQWEQEETGGNGIAAVPEETASETQSEDTSPSITYTTVLQKDGELYHEKNDTTEYYFYTKDDEQYVYYYDDMMGMADGEWKEMPTKDSNLGPAFDFSILDVLESDMLVKIDGAYIPDDMDQVFFLFFDDENRSHYKNRHISFQFAAGKLINITASYIFNGEYQIKEVYSFEYGNASVEIPNIAEGEE